MTWYLLICAGMGWNGCIMVKSYPMPSEESCFKALAAVRFSQPLDDENSTSVAYCFPQRNMIGAHQ